MHQAVIGLGFGDEGKGLVVNRLASRRPGALNVRFSGGHQVGHTVMFEDGMRHVFSNFGSATMQGMRTYWSKDCTVCPVGLMNELDILREKGIGPKIRIHADCPVVTPMDRDANRNAEEDNQHGSCGVGFGATIQREEDFYSLKFRDIFYPDIMKERIRAIAGYYGVGYVKYLEIMGDFLDSCRRIVDESGIKMDTEELDSSESYIFEGSQGMLLDQHYGFFPNVTRSNTGSKNIAWLADDIEWFLVTRAYQTRHGNGFMTNERLSHNIKKNENETNVTNEWQGKFRRSLLDVSLLEYAIQKDDAIRTSQNRNLVITCLDHIENECRFTYKGELVYCSSVQEFVIKVAGILGIDKVYASAAADGSKWYVVQNGVLKEVVD